MSAAESGRGLGQAELPGLKLFRRGKVRDTFDLGERLLMVSTDRLSAFDSVLPSLIPDRGRVLTAMSRHWFADTADLVPNHLLDDDPETIPHPARPQLQGRCMWVRRAERIDVECVVRGRLAGSGWAEYADRGTLAEEPVSPGLAFGAELSPARFTPASKNDAGHDQNISRRELAERVGSQLATELEERSLAIFERAREGCRRAGFTLVDTKFEFGFVEGRLTLIDELLTPDSSRLWEAAEGGPGGAAGFDKQLVREHLLASGWDRNPPAPPLPPELVAETRRRYLEACRRITGHDL